MQRLLCRIQLLANFAECGRVSVIAVHISQEFDQLLESFLVKIAVMFQAILGASTNLIKRLARFGYADNRDVQAFIADQPLNGRKNLLVRKVPGSPEEDQCV